jgi:hypothetical protein
MSEDEPEPLSSEMREALCALPRHAEPPPGAERRVLRKLTRLGLVRPPARWWRHAALAAALLLSFAAGHLSGRSSAPPPQGAAGGESWLLLLHGAAEGPGDDLEARVSAISAWVRELRGAGVAVAGARLAPDADWLGAGTSPGGSELGGYFLLSGVGRERALAIARSCPLLAFGGRIELRRIAS